MKKLLAVVLVIAMMAAIMTGCGGGEAASEEGTDMLKVGIVQIVEHPSLDTIRENIMTELAAQGYDETNITIDYKNAQNDTNNLKTICQSFSADGCDLIIAIATPSAQAALGETTEIPIVFAAVTDPVGAGLVASNESPGGNVTGTSDLVSAEKIMNLAKEITPEIKTIGTIYSSGEVNSLSVVADLKEYAAANGMTVVESPVMNTSEIQQAAQSLVGKVDAVFTPIDNTVASAMPAIVDVLNEADIPFYVGADSMVNDGGLATYGVNYVELGKQTGEMAADVLGGADTATMPVRTIDALQVYVNTNTAAEIGIEVPQTVLDKATVLGE